ncbi:hypothetical protein AU467_05085 [Mesorhizobium loti]|uniref:Metallo-beta-lactamase domain-containing protein n=1 Tax=Rhizobium loti TaxID=381 RepID=A0A117N2Q0_RHILI|nr:hypothetical protein AU467_05085 [Mesorhizobium loti]
MDEWHPIEGVANAEILALINKPSITNSNAYLLRTPQRLVIFDPGADPAQIDRLNTLVAGVLEEAQREVFLILTHAHIDHFAGVERLRTGAGKPWTLVHHEGARAIRAKDRRHTLAILYRKFEVPDLAVDATLFGPETLPGLRREQRPGPDGQPIPVEILPLGPGVDLEIYATPGHSSCSCSFRIGRHLIIGDVTFGANPGLAGLIGWSSEGLTYSTRLLRQIIDEHAVSICWTGHGDAMSGALATKMLATVASQVASFGEIAVIDEERITLLRRFATELLHEIERLFTLIGARLMIVAHHLELLEETVEAARLESALNIDAVEAQLGEFRQFCSAFERGEQPELSVAMKAAATMTRLRRTVAEYRQTETGSLSPAARAEHLVDAFLQAIRGLSFQDAITPVNLAEMVDKLVAAEQSPPFGVDDFMAASDDDEAFRRLLVGNLSSASILRGRDIVVRHDRSEAWDGTAAANVPWLQNILLSTLEAMAAAEANKRIDIIVAKAAGSVAIGIATDPPGPPLPAVRTELYHRTMQQMGGGYEIEDGAVVIKLRLAGAL